MKFATLADRIGNAFKVCTAIGGTAAMMAFAPSAHAIVVVSPAANIVVPATNAGIYINVISGAAGASTTPGWDINPWGDTFLGFFNPVTQTGAYVVGAGAGAAPSNLAVGSVVSVGSTFGSGTANFTAGWNLNATNYVGFRFLNEGNGLIHYGYAAIAVGSAVTNRTVSRIFYENVPGASISVVPEPASVAMMLLGGLVVGGVALRRRRIAA